MTSRLIVTTGFLVGLSAAAISHAADPGIDTRHLTVSDATGRLSAEQLRNKAHHAQETLERVLAFWSAEDGTGRFGKIHVVFDAPRRGTYSSVFYWEMIRGERRRVVRVFGFERPPQMLAHKLTSAVLPQQDKLIRNLMGILTEARVGNPMTFPRCGFDGDEWVLALLDANSYIPLGNLGADHESWGMRDAGGGQMQVFDRAKQHKAYAEAGSFGSYLFRAYGVDKLKHLQQLSQVNDRPLKDVFGAGLGDLESAWLAALRSTAAARKGNVAILSRLIDQDPNTACTEAQRLGAAKP
jgi:hypothetical protein